MRPWLGTTPRDSHLARHDHHRRPRGGALCGAVDLSVGSADLVAGASEEPLGARKSVARILRVERGAHRLEAVLGDLESKAEALAPMAAQAQRRFGSG